MAIHEIQVLQLIMTGGSGLIGVGIGIGMFRGVVKQLKKDVETIKSRQAKLRGENNGGRPEYVRIYDCGQTRSDCLISQKSQISGISETLDRHAKAIRVFENYARWAMQNKGLKIEEINQILMIN